MASCASAAGRADACPRQHACNGSIIVMTRTFQPEAIVDSCRHGKLALRLYLSILVTKQ